MFSGSSLRSFELTPTIRRAREDSPPSPLNGERAGVRGDNARRPKTCSLFRPTTDLVMSGSTGFAPDHPSPITPLPVEWRGEPDLRNKGRRRAARQPFRYGEIERDLLLKLFSALALLLATLSLHAAQFVTNS